MRIWDKITILSMLFMADGYSQDCTYILEKIYLNDQILTFYLHSFDRNNSQSQIDLFTYKIISSGDNCNQTIQIIYTLSGSLNLNFIFYLTILFHCIKEYFRDLF